MTTWRHILRTLISGAGGAALAVALGLALFGAYGLSIIAATLAVGLIVAGRDVDGRLLGGVLIGVGVGAIVFASHAAAPAISIVAAVLAALVGLYVLCRSRLDARRREEQIARLSAILVHEDGAARSADAPKDQHLNFCRSLVALCQRAEGPFGVIAFTRRALPPSPEEGFQSRVAFYEDRLDLAALVSARKRDVDVMVLDRDRDLFILACPLSSEAAVVAFADACVEAVKAQLQIDLSYGVAMQPEFGATFDELVEEASGRAAHPSTKVARVADQAPCGPPQVEIAPKQASAGVERTSRSQGA